MCCNHKVILCSFIFSVNVVCFAQGSPRIGTSGTCSRTASVTPERGEVLCFVHAHLPHVLQLASSTSAVVIEVQQDGFYLGMHDHHCFSCHLPSKRVSADATHIASAELEGRPDFLVCSITPRWTKTLNLTMTRNQTWKWCRGWIISHREQLVK